MPKLVHLSFGDTTACCLGSRCSKRVQSLAFLFSCRRLLRVAASMYYDDLTTQDWACTAVAAQSCAEQLAKCLGFPFAAEKRQLPAAQGDFLGVVHDLQKASSDSSVTLWVRDRLVAKIRGITQNARAHGYLTPGVASKLFGCLGFLDQGAFGCIARSGLSPIKSRQNLEHDTHLPPQLLMADRVPPRPAATQDGLAAASPAFAPGGCIWHCARQGSGGFLVVTPQSQRLGSVVDINEDVFRLWDSHDAKIAQLELLMVLQALVVFPDVFRRTTGVFYVDNVAALMTLVRGRSDNAELDQMARLVYCLLFRLECTLWCEWVQSASNWNDGISRCGFSDPFIKRFRFQVHASAVPLFLWRLPLRAVFQVFAFLERTLCEGHAKHFSVPHCSVDLRNVPRKMGVMHAACAKNVCHICAWQAWSRRPGANLL